MPSITRRDFLHDSAALAAALAAPALPPGPALPTTLRKRKRTLATAFAWPSSAFAAGAWTMWAASPAGTTASSPPSATPTSAVVGRRHAHRRKAQGTAPQVRAGPAQGLDDKDIDIITIATPNHWHALAAIWAMQAGKDVYVEKPVSHNVSEGRRIVETARKYNRICQTGTQSRSQPRHARGHGVPPRRQARQGQARPRPVLQAPPEHRQGHAAAAPIPKTIDYDLWCGPAPHRSRSAASTCITTGTGSGTTATATSATRASTRWTSPAGAWARTSWPTSVVSVGGRFGYVDDGQTANTQICVFDYRRLRADLRGPRPGAPTRYPRRHGRQHLPLHRRLPGRSRRLQPRGGRFAPRARSSSRFRRRRRPFRQLRPGRPQPPPSRTCTPTSSKATCPAPCATWATSATGSAHRRRSASKARLLAMTGRPTKQSHAWKSI